MANYEKYFQQHHLVHSCKFCNKKISLQHWHKTTLSSCFSQKTIPQFCNHFCRGKHFGIRLFVRGKKHPAYTTGTGRGYNGKERRAIFQILELRCHCASTQRLELHHKDKNPRNNSLDNLQILCKSCHSTLHWKDRKKFPTKREYWQDYHKQQRLKKIAYYKSEFKKVFGTDKFYTANDICHKRCISRERVRQLRRIGRLKYTKIGGRYLYEPI